MRQNPIQQKRGAMNVKLRVASANSANLPSVPVAGTAPVAVSQPVAPAPVPSQPSVPVATPQPATPPPAPIQPTVPIVVQQPVQATVAPIPEQPATVVAVSAAPMGVEMDISGGKADPYTLSTIFVSLLSGSKKSEIMPLLRSGLARAKARKDDLFITIFEGGIAANQPLPDIKRAITAYHRAFDLCEQRQDAPSGFLHSMVWSFYTDQDGNSEVAGLMERARQRLKHRGSSVEKNNELLQTVWTEFEQLPNFAERVESYRAAQDKESAPVINKLLRESRLDATKTMLFFPRSWRSRRANDVRPFSSVVSQTCGNYFFWRNGFGTVINPDLTFIDNFYRLGGVLRDIHNIVFTVSPSSSGNPLLQFQTLFDLLRQANVMQSVRFFVRPNVAEENDAEFRQLEDSETVESIRSLRNGIESDLLGGGSLTFRNDSMLLLLPENRTLQFLDSGTDDLESQTEELDESRDLMVLPVKTVEELVWTARLIKERKPKLVVFDLPKENNHLILLDPSIRNYVAPQTPIAYADSALVIDILTERFIDSVKAFAVSERDCWSENGRLTFEPNERHLPEGLLYFEQGTEACFADEHADILEAFLYNRRCRRGLYFT